MSSCGSCRTHSWTCPAGHWTLWGFEQVISLCFPRNQRSRAALPFLGRLWISIGDRQAPYCREEEATPQKDPQSLITKEKSPPYQAFLP